MCLSSVYRQTGGEPEFICKNIARVEHRDGILILTDIMGIKREIRGEIGDIDLLENNIIITAEQ